jgi:NAD(P)-dependent dehydrogenase (short-subunit alcohol dehydrogenase family)
MAGRRDSAQDGPALKDLFSVDGKVALVTGATSGIGHMIAAGLVDAGVKVYIASRKAEDCAEVAAALSMRGECLAIPADLSTEAGCAGLARALADNEETLHLLVNNAGATWGAPLEAHDEKAWERVLSLNVKGVFHLTRFLAPLLTASGTADDPSRVINLGSVDGLRVPQAENYAYATSKAAVHHLTRQLARTLAPLVTVNALAPGPFESRMMAASLRAMSDQIIAKSPLRRLGRDDDVVGTTVFLASRAGSYLTGAVIPVDGGISTLLG